MLLYIHGFNSSPQSTKAIQTQAYIAANYPELNFQQPQLPNDPQAAITLLSKLTETAKIAGEPLRYIGSSLGGYFATWLAETYGGKAVLINPAVFPYDFIEDYIGEQCNPYTGEHYHLLPEHQDILKEIDTPAVCHPDRFLVLLQSGDEVLDYRQALAKYQCCEMCLEAGGDHSFVGYNEKLPQITQFLYSK